MADKPVVSVPKGQTGPVVTGKPGESLDLTGFYDSGVPDGPTGSTPPKPGSVRLIDTPDALPDPEGDTVRSVKDGVALVDVPEGVTPTVGELRKAGYTVDGKDGDVPTEYTADSPTAPNEVHLVDFPADEPEPEPAKKQVRQSPENK